MDEEIERPRITPYLYYPDATKAVAFLIDAFGFPPVSRRSVTTTEPCGRQPFGIRTGT